MDLTAGTPRLPFVLVAAFSIAVCAGCSRTPAEGSAEAGFARDMATHHAQAVEMGFLMRDRTRDETVRVLAADIIVTQSTQRGIFMAWLQTWNLPQASGGPRMAWMSDAAHTGSAASAPPNAGPMSSHSGHAMAGMPLMLGMASDADLNALRQAEGRDAEVRFLQLMIRHHEGGVLMARALLAQSRREDVLTLVRGIESAQAGEIATMAAMLRERGAEPLPSMIQ